MKKIVLFSIFSLLICLCNGNGEKVEPEPPTQLPVIPTTTPAPKPTTTTPKPTIKPTTASTTTPAPTTPTTTTTPSTTTTTTVSPNTTTVTPTTTAAPTPTTTTKPTPKPKPEVGTWALTFTNTNRTCLTVKMALEIMVHYERTDKEIGNTTIIVPKNADVSGYCFDETKNNTQQLVLKMGVNNSDSVTFNFEKNDTLKKFMLTSTEIQLTPTEDVFPMIKSNATITGKHDNEEFLTPLQMSYRCKPQKDYNLTTTNNALLGKIIVSDLQIEAFHNATGMKFDSAKDCEASETPGIVPIAVGCSLAALIIIVLVAYLVGRRRSQARGYLSMFSEKQREAEYIPMKNISCFGK